MADNDGDAIIEMTALPPRWIDIQDEVVERLAGITKQFPQLDQLHHKHTLPGFEDESVKKQEEAAIERISQQLTRDFHQCQKDIARIDAMVKEAKRTGNMGQGDEAMARNLKISLASRVQETSVAFRKKQSNYLKKLRALEGYANPVEQSSKQAKNPYNDPSMVEAEADTSLSESTLQQSAQKRVQNNDAVIAQREREINDIAKGIIQLSDMFKDLQAMVIDQGTLLDRIDYNVEIMRTEVKEAEKELITATGYQKSTMKRKIIFLLLLLVIGMLILVIIKPKRGSGGPDTAKYLNQRSTYS